VTCRKIFYRHSGGEAGAQIIAAVTADALITAAVSNSANAIAATPRVNEGHFQRKPTDFRKNPLTQHSSVTFTYRSV
jgi:hypothetical protein